MNINNNKLKAVLGCRPKKYSFLQTRTIMSIWFCLSKFGIKRNFMHEREQGDGIMV